MELTETLSCGITFFSKLTDCPELILDQQILYTIFAMIGFMLCFLGLKSYRAYISLTIYICIVVFFCVLWKETTEWGRLAAGFSVVGCVCAFLIFQWKELGACIFSALLSSVLFYTIISNIWISILVAVSMYLLAYKFPLIIVEITTSIFGACLLEESVLKLPIFNQYILLTTWQIIICLSVLGIVTQILTNKKYYKIYKESRK